MFGRFDSGPGHHVDHSVDGNTQEQQMSLKTRTMPATAAQWQAEGDALYEAAFRVAVTTNDMGELTTWSRTDSSVQAAGLVALATYALRRAQSAPTS